jgi:hypothetical protein
MNWTRQHMIRNIGSLALVLTAGCGAMADSVARTAGECQSADRHLARCGLGLDDSDICSDNTDGPVRPTLTPDQSSCIKELDCGELRSQADGGTICGTTVRYK